jgi:hypothetical protein
MRPTPKRRRKRGSQRYAAPGFRSYVSALGQLALAWNDLQESLAALFLSLHLHGPPQAGDRVDYAPLWVWHSIRSDRTQKEMLRALIDHTTTDWGRPNFKADTKQLIVMATALEGARNDAIHSPLFSTDKSLYGSAYRAGANEKVAPAAWQFNPRAVSLAKRQNLLGEFRYCRDTAIALSDYARAIDVALMNPARPWPDKPSLPTRSPKTVRQDRQRQTK